MEKTKQERQAYIEAIESGRYKTGTVANTKILAVIAIVFGIILTIMFLAVGNKLTQYERKGEVVKSNRQEIVVVDLNGETWKVKAQGFKVGDKVVMTMREKGSTSICDDEVIDISKR